MSVRPVPSSESRSIVARKDSTDKPLKVADLRFTDVGNAKRYADHNGSDLHFIHEWREWLYYNGKVWTKDRTGEVMRRAKATIRSYLPEAAEIEDAKDRNALIKHAQQSESEMRLKAMVNLANSEPGIPILPDELDRNPWKFNCENGTVDLKMGKLERHNRNDLITKLAPVFYDANAECPLFLQFLGQIFAGNGELVRFLQTLCGYCLTGMTTEQIVVIFHGMGANGKSTLLELFLYLLGDYGMQATSDLLLAKKEDSHPTGLADLFGKRFVGTAEIDRGRRLAEALVKQLSGSDRIRARRMRQDNFEFTPTHKIVLATNHKPIIRGTDHAIWRRMRLVPFTVTIPDDQQDKNLATKLREELPGILNWAIEGCLAWHKEGLGMPEEVKQATGAYRSEMDILSDFMEECCIEGPGFKITASELYKEYNSWSSENGEKPETQREFGMKLSERGFIRGASNGKKIWRGLRKRGLDDSAPSVPNFGISSLSSSRERIIQEDGALRDTKTLAEDCVALCGGCQNCTNDECSFRERGHPQAFS